MRFSNKMVDVLVSTIDFYLSDLSTKLQLEWRGEMISISKLNLKLALNRSYPAWLGHC